ncbi:SDR family NAD(P)-dependent oxidoreductase [Balneola sp. MJW-20]|uniref:SDR family NAD(P)-dependent oxidoreductase n=1 Tax=Gracilimonas aurantiaca TaxID=3234185 RepID=UPI003466CFF2
MNKKTIIVTGASRGIGFETALHLDRSGHKVIALARSTDRLKKLETSAENGNIRIFGTDLTSEEEIGKLKAELREESIDGIINNAGALDKGPFLETSIETFKHLMDVNVYAIVRLVQQLFEHLNQGAHIVNISSMSGFQGSLKFPGLSAYSASKAAVIGLSELMSAEFTDYNISVNCLCIGAVQTEMLEEAFPGFDAPVSAAEMGSYISDFVLKGHNFYNGKVLPVALNDPS